MALRHLNIERDFGTLHRLLADADCVRYLVDPPVTSEHETRVILQRWTTGWEDTSWSIFSPPGTETLGRVSTFQNDDGDWEVGIMMLQEGRGRGLARSAVLEAAEKTFESKQAPRIVADIDPENLSSIALFQRLGFQEFAFLKQSCTTHLGVRDSRLLELTRENFASRYGR